jgi:hypothetical protein
MDTSKDPCPLCGGRKTRGAVVCVSCRSAYYVGDKNGNWKGGKIVGTDGYVRVYRPEDPRANMGRYMAEHKVVMEELLGRPLLPNENVHHKNGNRQDNRPSNLELWTSSQPTGQRVEDLVVWAKEILGLYGEGE